MIKSLIFRFLAAFAKPKHLEDDFWTEEEDVYLQEKFNLRGSKAQRMQAIREWSKPENIKRRLKEFKPGVTVNSRFNPLSVPDPLPEEFKGQQPSTIQAILRHRIECTHEWIRIMSGWTWKECKKCGARQDD